MKGWAIAGLVSVGVIALSTATVVFLWRRYRRVKGAGGVALLQLPAPGADGLVRHFNLAYLVEEEAPHPRRHRLDVYAPSGKSGMPVLLFIHGGGWVMGHKSSAAFGTYDKTGESFASHGAVVIMANYRLAPWARHPEQVKDVARALRWTRRNAERYGGDPNRLFIGGHSAGGHLAALVATDAKYLKAVGLSQKSLKGCIAISAVYKIGSFVAALSLVPGARYFAAMGFVFGTDPEAQRDASPLTHLSKKSPPFLTLYADHEWFGIGRQTQEFLHEAAERGVRVSALEIANRNHVTIIAKARDPDDAVSKAVGDFLALRS